MIIFNKKQGCLNKFKNCIKQGCLITPYKGGYFNQVENITLFNKIGLNN